MALTDDDDFTSEQFALRWNDFSNNLSHGFSAHLNNKDLVDVTLAIEGKLLQAHKLILSVCSTYFQEIFKVNPCHHPVVILKDMKYNHVEALVKFMYQGEVNVKQEELGNFLKVAEVLKVKGLTLETDRIELDELPTNGQGEHEVKNLKVKQEKNKKRAQDTQSSKNPKRSRDSLKTLKTDSEDDKDCGENLVDPADEPNNGESEDLIKECDDLNDDDLLTDDMTDNIPVEPNIGPVTYRLSARGRPQLVYEGFVYNLTSRSEILNRSHYRCAEQHRGCRGKCAVIAERFMPTGVKDHNHPPGYLSEEDYRKKKLCDD
ncbi:protein bric-a-brac 1-like [Microplitis mediator]|uniref:protein bric-a-brac 1-like n=1 Tax=Microplitis mediator TaxID=375433 RepID=UPI0025568B02|nr:protein bric-a-brac 1-like [Microplitis mediator]